MRYKISNIGVAVASKEKKAEISTGYIEKGEYLEFHDYDIICRGQITCMFDVLCYHLVFAQCE